MKKLFVTAVIACSTLFLFGCANSQDTKNGEVVVYNWGEYIDPDVLTQFEEEKERFSIKDKEPCFDEHDDFEIFNL